MGSPGCSNRPATHSFQPAEPYGKIWFHARLLENHGPPSGRRTGTTRGPLCSRSHCFARYVAPAVTPTCSSPAVAPPARSGLALRPGGGWRAMRTGGYCIRMQGESGRAAVRTLQRNRTPLRVGNISDRSPQLRFLGIVSEPRRRPGRSKRWTRGMNSRPCRGRFTHSASTSGRDVDGFVDESDTLIRSRATPRGY
jgi:hypothetical protein